MGIPSYYKKLVQSVKGLVGRSTAGPVDYLWFDYNCLIYYVLKSMPAYLPADKEAWERTLIERTCDYTKIVVKSVGNPRNVFLGVDGVVPLAKIKQQRLRRWKSIWTTEEERRLGKIGSGVDVWDRNALTPGTHFMDKLNGALTNLATTEHWTMSGVYEPGEGEHKVMRRLRELDQDCPQDGPKDGPANHVIYGLDADLILLTLYNARFLHEGSHVYLLREDEKECQVNPVDGTIGYVYSYFNIIKLREAILRSIKRTCTDADDEPALALLTDYIFAMTLLGNDFVPHGLALSLKGNGYVQLVRMLKQGNRPRLINDDLTWNREGLAYVYAHYAGLEEGLIHDEIENKRASVRHKAVYGDDANQPWARAYSYWMKKPARRMDENALLADDGRGFRADWQRIYYRVWFGGKTNRKPVCDAYNTGLEWVLRYYTGKAVDLFWYYPWNLPPLMSDLAASYGGWTYREGRAQTALKPVEQCALALPASSLHLCMDKRYHVLPRLIPAYFPTRCRFFYAGKHQLWECEPIIPIITPARLRALVK